MKSKGIKLNKIFVFMVVVSLVFQLITPVEVHATLDELQDASIEDNTDYTIATDSNAEDENEYLEDNLGTSDETSNTEETNENEEDNDIVTDEPNESEDDSTNTEENIDDTDTKDEDPDDDISTEDTSAEDTELEDTKVEDTDLEDNTVSGNNIPVENEVEALNNLEPQSMYPDNIQSLLDILGESNVEVDIDTNTIKLLQDINITSSLTVNGSIKLDLNGNTLSGTAVNNTVNLINIQGTLEILGGDIKFSGGDNAISIASTGKLVNNDCNITTNSCTRAIFSSGAFDMYGGTISNNTSSANGAGIVVHGTSGIFNMYGGTISSNTGNIGGGLRVQTGATANISGNSVIENNTGKVSAGGIHVLNATCNISGDAVVKNNNSIKGGGIYLEGNSTMTLSGDCRVEGNSVGQIEKDSSATLNITGNAYVESDEAPPVGQTLQDLIDNTPVGGTLTLDRNYMNQSGVTINKDITIDFNGYTVEGAIASSGQLFSIQNCKAKLTNGKISQRSGTGTYYVTVNIQSNSTVDFEELEITTPGSQSILVENSELNLSECNIHDCGNNGGNIRLITGTLNMNSGSISSCRSFMGGAIRAASNSTLNIKGGTIENNRADSGVSNRLGGAIYSVDSIVNIEGGVLKGNKSVDNGGAIYISGGSLSVGNCDIIDNSCGNHGGAIYCTNSELAIVNGANISDNSCGVYGYGGAVYADSTVNIQGNPVLSNNKACSGGALYTLGKTTINGGTFSNNVATQIGGGICGSDLIIEGKVLIDGNQAVIGGGVSGGCMEGWSDISRNQPATTTIGSGVVISNNKAVNFWTGSTTVKAYGGGIRAYDLIIDGDAQIVNNTSAGNGGGIYSRNNMKISSGNISNNTASIGGGIFLFNEGFIQGTPQNRVFIQNNTATDTDGHGFAGGGIFVEHLVDSKYQGKYGASLQINGVIIRDNTALGGGGIGGCGEAMVNSYGTLGMSLHDNTATGTGQDAIATDLYLDGKGTLTTQGIGGSDIHFVGIGRDTTAGSWRDVDIESGSIYLEGMRFDATMTSEHMALAEQIAGVLISGNTCRSHGGGIGGNGEILIGMPVREVTVQKIWDDNNDEYGERPSMLSVTLSHRGKRVVNGILVDVDEVIDTQVITAQDNWRYTWSNLEELDESNSPWEYYIDEIDTTEDMKDYKKVISGTNITNTYTKISFEIQKLWEDNNDIDNLRPEKIEVEIYRNNVLYNTIELTKDNNWKYTVEKVDKFDDTGAEYKYTIEEKEVPPGYTHTINGFTITNKHTPIEKISFTVQKIWDDEQDIDGLRPEDIEAEVYRNDTLYDTVTLNEANNWKKDYTDLPKTDIDGNEYKYTVKEKDSLEGYTTTVNGTTITNSHVHIPLIDIDVVKIWDDENDKDKIRPNKVNAILYRDNIQIDTVELNELNNWQYTFKDMPKIDSSRHEYVYRIEEEVVPNGYTSVINGYEITNKHIPADEPEVPRTTFTIHKIWNDNNNANNIRPQAIEIDVYRNGLWYDTIILSENNSWSHTYIDIEKEDADGNEYVYTVSEPKVPDGYKSNIQGYNITNTFIEKEEPEKVRFMIQKIWDDDNNKDGIRPSEVTFTVYRNTDIFDVVVLSQSNNWRKEYTNLDSVDSNGNKYTYSVVENSVPEGYVSATNGFVITNKHIPKDEPPGKEKTTFTVSKIWEDNDNKDKIRPESIEIQVFRNNELWNTAILNSNNNWSVTYLDVDLQDDNGNVYNYTVAEPNVPNGYKAEINGYTIINKQIKPVNPPDDSKEPDKPENDIPEDDIPEKEELIPYKPEDPVDTPRHFGDPPKTGDDTDLLTPFVLMVTSLFTIVILEIQQRRDKKKIKDIEDSLNNKN